MVFALLIMFRFFIKQRDRFLNFWNRFYTAWQLLRGKHKYWVLLTIDQENLARLLADGDDVSINVLQHGVSHYHHLRIIKEASNSIEWSEMLLGRILFELEMEEFERKMKGGENG